MHERQHVHIPPQHATTEHEDLAPGRTSRAAQLVAPIQPLISGLLQRKARDGNGVAGGADAAVASASTSSGHALPGGLMRKFEAALEADLSGVRVHTGAASAAAADAVGAQAYTVGQDIHFAAGRYDPASASGEHLLAHEVAHTVQQRGGTTSRQNKLEVSTPFEFAEHEADRAADAMVAGRSAIVAGSSSVARKIARKDNPETGTCDPEDNQSHSEGGGEKKEGADPEVAAKCKPLKIAGMDLGLKADKDGFSMGLSKQLSVEMPPVPVIPPVLNIVLEPSISASIKVSWTKAKGWAGDVGLTGSFGVFLRLGTQFAYVQGGGYLELPLKSTISDAGLSTLKGDLECKLTIEAAVKVPWSGKDGKTPNLKDPGGWKNKGGVSFECVLASAKFVHLEISTDGITATWMGPDIASEIMSKLSSLEQAKSDYERNFSGGGAEGSPSAPPGGGSGPSDDGAGGAPSAPSHRDDGAGGAGGAHN